MTGINAKSFISFFIRFSKQFSPIGPTLFYPVRSSVQLYIANL